ncbi:hypothetical protein NIES4102_04640 [Chondrocystis sp. NIES-4102]|nr:hypothetical protein NIES4102_04640 [Chondrocystis sp. NIES-4102]
MNQESNTNKENFLYPRSSYHGNFSPQNLAFNANLQEFAQQVAYICGLETNGKVTSAEAYDRIKKVWQELKTSKKQLLGQNPEIEK